MRTQTLAVATITQDRWAVPSRSVAGDLHVVKRVGSHLSCTCDACFYRGACAHIDAVLGAQPVPVADPAKIAMAKRLGMLAS